MNIIQNMQSHTTLVMVHESFEMNHIMLHVIDYKFNGSIIRNFFSTNHNLRDDYHSIRVIYPFQLTS